MQMPSRQEIRVRNLFNVVDCKLHWQRNGDYLCVKVDRTPKGTQVLIERGQTAYMSQISFKKKTRNNKLTFFAFSGCRYQL